MDLYNIANIALSVIVSFFSVIASIITIKSGNSTIKPQKKEENNCNPNSNLNINIDNSTTINSNNTINIGSNNTTNINYSQTNQNKQNDDGITFLMICVIMAIIWCLVRTFAFVLTLSILLPLVVTKFKNKKDKKDSIFLISVLIFMGIWSYFYWFPISVPCDYTANLFEIAVNTFKGDISSNDVDMSNALKMLGVSLSQLVGCAILFSLITTSFVDNCCDNFNLHIKQSTLIQKNKLCNKKKQIGFAIISLLLITGLLGNLIHL